MKPYFRLFIWCFSILLSVIIQESVIANSTILSQGIFLPLYIALLLVVYNRHRYAIVFMTISAYIIELSSTVQFGTIIISSLIALSVVLFIQKNVFKSQALYTAMIHVGMGTFVYHIGMTIAIIVERKLHLIQLQEFYWRDYLRIAGIQTVTHVILTVVCIMVITAVYKRLLHSPLRV